MRVYLAGPVSLGGQLDWQAIERNTARFKHAAEWVRGQGHEPVDPTVHAGDPSWTWRQWMQPALHALVDADGICLLPGWQQSRGAVVEFQLAYALGHTILFMPSEALP
jgi:Domain of unknown function (DUF4406)